MNKIFNLILLILFFTDSNAQISIGYNLGWSANNANLSTKNGYVTGSTYIDELNKNKLSKMSFNSCININYSLNKKWTLESGVEYFNKGYKTVEIINFENQFNDPAIPQNFSTFASYQSISIPVNIYYHLGESRISYIVGTGLALNTVFNSEIKLTSNYSDGRTQTDAVKTRTFLNNFQISSLILIACQYELSRKIKLRLSANYRYDLNDLILNDYNVKTRLHTASIQLGLFYVLK